ncbi:hypothetical protein Angca_003696 [Angiostrongylus cantonensis]|nr:hypothetical protein Angca_003696 [Angiostrongylus cantonensis]
MNVIKRRAALTIPVADEFDTPIIDISGTKNHVTLSSSVLLKAFRPTSLQQVRTASKQLEICVHYNITTKNLKVVDETHFSKNEIRSIYRAFKETSPNAVINKAILREKFAELFPHGNIEHYSDLLFDTFDNDNNGTINFQEFVKALSVLCRGTIDEKLEWLYKLYDPKGKGEITWQRLFYVITSMDDLMGKNARPMPTNEQRAQHTHNVFQVLQFDGSSLLFYSSARLVFGSCQGTLHNTQDRSLNLVSSGPNKYISCQNTKVSFSFKSKCFNFQKFDIGKRGRISKEDFFTVCKTDRQIIESMSSLYTILPG